MTVRIAHISDTHFGTEVIPVMESLQAAMREQAPDIIILSGDITQRARAGEFKKAVNFAKGLPAPVLTVPGNHDIPLYNVARRFLSPYGRYKRAFGAREWLWQGHGMAVVGFDATNPCRHTRGALDPDRTLETLAAARKTIGADTPLLAVVHQPFVVAWPEDEDERLIHAAGNAAAFAAHKVKAVLSGHVHVPFISTLEQDFPGIADLPLHCGAGTAFSHRVRPGAPNSFNMLTVPPQGDVSVEVFLYDTNAGRFIARPASG